MKNGIEIARHYKSLGLNPLPIPVDSKKPLNDDHNTVPMTEDMMVNGQVCVDKKGKSYTRKFDWEAIGISTGIISGGLEVIDFDLKNADNPEEVMETYKSRVSRTILNKLVVQKTQSGGYHFIYRCEDVSSSKKLAKNPEGKAIIETRGEGGLIKCAPSEGYELIQGTFDNVPIITPEERLQLFVSAKMLSQTIKKDANKRASKEDLTYFKRFPKYNADSDNGIALLEEHGWTVKKEDDEWISLTRPNSKSGDIHAGYHKEGMFLYVFSTAQSTFEEERPYNNHAIYAELECDGNYSMAYAKLYESGWGEDISTEEGEEEEWSDKLGSVSFLSDDIEENTYLEQARKGEIAQGLSTGWRDIDEYFRLKPNSINIGLGYDGVGKSVFMLSLATASSVLHDWKWGMVMPENRTAMSRRRLIETKSGRPIESFKREPLMFDKQIQESRESFKIISNKKHYSISDVIDMGKRLYEYYGINALLIDPWNFFKVSGDGYGHNNEMLSQLRVFAESYCSVYVMAHPSSFTPRNSKDADGYLQAPSKYSIQGGADFPYRVDDFFITHRITNHSDRDVRRTMQFIAEKVKEQETGGKVHDSGDYSSLIYETRHGFTGYWDSNGDNPMYKALKAKTEIREKLVGISPEEAF